MSNRPSFRSFLHRRPDTSGETPRPRFFYGWVVLGVSALAMFISGPGQTYVASVFIIPIMEETGWSFTLMSGLYTAGSLTAAAAMLLVGRLFDRHGARKMFVAIGLLFGLAALGMSWISHPIHLFIGFAMLRTLGQGSLTFTATTLVSLWFVRFRGRAMALSSLGGVAGQAAIPPLVYLLIDNLGWRNTWIVLAVCVWVVFVPPAMLLTRRSPESIGLLPDGETPRPQSDADSTARQAPKEDVWTLPEAVRTRTFWLLMLAVSSNSLVTTGLTFQHVSFMGSKGLDAGAASVVFTVLAIATLAGSFVSGFLVDRLPNRALLVGSQAILAIAMLWTFLIDSSWQAMVYGAILGFGNGLHMTLSAVIWPNYFGRRNLGSIRGAATTAMIGFAAVGPLPFGLIFGLTQRYDMAVLVFLVLPFTSAVAAVMAAPPRKRPSTA